MRFCSVTLGCKVNQYETRAIAGILVSRGHEHAQPGEGCDVCIINTCAVTGESARKSRQAVRHLKKTEPEALIAVCGCLSQIDYRAACELDADIIGGSGDRQAFALEVEELAEHAGRSGIPPLDEAREATPYSGIPLSSGIPAPEHHSGVLISGATRRPAVSSHIPSLAIEPGPRVFEELPPGADAGQTRAQLKIQDGCDNFCAYCVIPYARGNARSLPVERAAANARMLDGQGYREIVVTGIEISSYGKDLPGSPVLSDVIREISVSAPHARLRLSSLDPGAITEGFCNELSSIPDLCDHFHLSLQSGCDETLRRMGRRYGAGAVIEAIAALRRRFPDCGVTADLIVGFPGETDAEFQQTLEFIESAAFSKMHVFPFSRRPGTRAADMPLQVAPNIKRERARAASAMAREMALSFRVRQIGKTTGVLFERKRGGMWTGHSSNYLEVMVKDGGKKNALRTVRITSVEDGRVRGEIIQGL